MQSWREGGISEWKGERAGMIGERERVFREVAGGGAGSSCYLLLMALP